MKPIALFIIAGAILISCSGEKTVVGKWNRQGRFDPSEIKRMEISCVEIGTYYVEPNLPNLPLPHCTGDIVSLDCRDGRTIIMSIRLNGDILNVKYKGQEFRFARE